jgi:hypothetical protein
MLSLRDLHSQLDEALNINSDESSLSHEYYTDLINQQRALWIRNEYNKNRTIDPAVQQEFCIEVELVNPTICCTTVSVGCKVLRTKTTIPNAIEFSNSKAISSVGPTNLMLPRFNIIDYARVPYAGSGRTGALHTYYFLYGEHLFITSKKREVNLIEKITIRGIFEDPTVLGNYTDCETGDTCWTLDSPYPLNSWMWVYMKAQILAELAQKQAIPLDDANNEKDDKTELNNGAK